MRDIKTEYSMLLALAHVARAVATLIASAGDVARASDPGAMAEFTPITDALAALALLNKSVDIGELLVLATHCSVTAARLESESAVVQRLRRKLDAQSLDRSKRPLPTVEDVSRETSAFAVGKGEGGLL